MATIRFYLRSKVDKLVPVYIRFLDGREIDLRAITPFRLYPTFWNRKKQTMTNRVYFSDTMKPDQVKDIEDRLRELKDFVFREHFKLTAAPTQKWLEDAINRYYYKDQRPPETLSQYIKRFVEEAKSGTRLATIGTTKRRYAYGSIRVLRGLMLSFEMFCKNKKKDYDFEDINIDFYNDFISFFYGRNCSANYIGKLISTLKTIMRVARDEGLHNNSEIERKAFKTLKEPVDNIYLTLDEVTRLYELNLNHKKHLQLIRDVFLVGVFTAQRYSDYSKINKSNVQMKDGEKYIVLTQQKTREKCIIPIRPELEAILQKYDYTMPKTHEQKLNAGIKDICFIAEIAEPIQVQKNKAGLIVKSIVKKCDLVRSHTARRTGCTLMYLAGIPNIDIMKISGHKTEKEFLKYINVNKEETAKRLSKHEYFSKPAMRVVS